MYQINNPGNLRYVGEDAPFQGEIRPNKNRVWREFQTMEHGFRAMAVLLGNYYKMGKRTFREMMRTYAPYGDGSNNPDNYAQKVADFVGFDPDEDMGWLLTYPEHIGSILYKMAQIENGSYPDRQSPFFGAQMYVSGRGSAPQPPPAKRNFRPLIATLGTVAAIVTIKRLLQ